MANVITGWVSEYTAQGMEGECWRVFQDHAHSQTRTQGWTFAGMHRLAAGQTLVIYDEAKQVLWQGLLKTRWLRAGLCWRACEPCDSDWSPVGVDPVVWAGWFRQHPPLAATLTTE